LTSGEKEFEIEEIEDFHINFFPRDFIDDYNKKGRYSLNYNEYDY
jgi:hypothetical protein